MTWKNTHQETISYEFCAGDAVATPLVQQLPSLGFLFGTTVAVSKLSYLWKDHAGFAMFMSLVCFFKIKNHPKRCICMHLFNHDAFIRMLLVMLG